MSVKQAFLSILHLFVVFSFFTGGFFFVVLPYLPEIQSQLVEKSTWIGLGLFSTALLLLLGFYALERGRYLVIRMGVLVDLQLVRQTIEDCFARQFSQKMMISDVQIVRDCRLEFKVNIAALDKLQRKALLIEAEKQLSILLRDRFGYSKPFYMAIAQSGKLKIS